MAVNNTGRFEIYEWGSATDPFTRDQMTESHQVLKARAAGFVTTQELQPDPNLNGYFYYTSTDSNAGILKYSNGVDWFNINESGTVVSLDGTTFDGSGNAFALANHKHALDDGIVTTSKIDDAAVNEDKIASSAVSTTKIAPNAVTNAKLGSDLNASKLTAGILPAARIDSGAITDDKLGTSLDISRFTTGTLDESLIPINAITNDKMANMAANQVKIRATQSTGDPQDATIGSDAVLGRDGTDPLGSTKVKTNMIANDQVTYAKMQNISSGYSILGKPGTGSGNVAEITAGPNSVLRRDGNNNLSFGTIDGAHITNNSIGSDQIASDAIGSDELANDAVDTDAIENLAVTTAKIDNDAVTLGTKTSGTYVKGVSAGTSISVSHEDDTEGGRTVTVNHGSTAPSLTAGFYGGDGSNGVVIEDISVDTNGHITAIGTRDMDEYYLRKYDAYGDSSANNGRRIYVQSNTPPHGSATGNLWFQI